MKLIPTILCGGAGSRLWPVSREMHPKPFIRLADGQSLLQKAFLRGAVLPNVPEMLTVTNRELLFKTKDDYLAVNAKNLPTSFILEPFGRNTAPAIAAAALHVAKTHGDDALLLVLAADHLIANQAAFESAVHDAVQMAKGGKLVTFGIHPHAPETGFGYIHADGNRVIRFVEKPSLDNAQAYLDAGDYWWNSGMFCFAAGSLLREMRQHCPDILALTEACLAQSQQTVGVGANTGMSHTELAAESFARVPDISIDYAVMEKSNMVAVVPCNIGWSDIGSWNAVSELTTADADGNRVEGDALLQDSHDNYIQSHDRLVATLGVNNLIIVDTPDALLIADHTRAQDVKNIYATLKANGHESYKLHRTVHRPWGTYTVLEEDTNYKIKRIEVKPGASLSLQMHQHRSEHWIVVNGVAKVTNSDQELLLNANESTYIPAGHKHRLENPGETNLVMIEVQSGEYLGEDDIVRFDDKYGRPIQ